MNKVFKIVWNQALQSWVVVSEFAKGKGKGKQRAVLSTALVGVFATGYAQAYTNTYGTATTNNTKDASIAIGAYGTNAANNAKATVDSKGSTAIGNKVSINGALSHYGVAIGYNTSISALGATAVESSSDSVAIGSNTEIKGQKSVAIGYNASVIGTKANETSGVAIGDDADVIAKNSIAIGHWAKASDKLFNTTVLGMASTVTSQGSAMALGDQAEAHNNYAAAMGTRAQALGYGSSAIGYKAVATSQNSVSLGTDSWTGKGEVKSTVAAANDAEKVVKTTVTSQVLDEGLPTERTVYTVTVQDGVNVTKIEYDDSKPYTNKDNYGQTAVGNRARAFGHESAAFGIDSTAYGSHGIAIGKTAMASGTRSTAMGYQALANQNYALALGGDTKAIGVYSAAVGSSAAASGTNSVAIGKSADSKGFNAIAMGTSSNSNATSTIAIGNTANASANYALALGDATVASGGNAVAIGQGTKASGASSAALGKTATATGSRALAFGSESQGYSADGVAIGTQAVAGKDNATVWRATAIGNKAQATANDSIAIGTNTITEPSTVVGKETTAVGAVAIGRDTINRGDSSVAIGDKINVNAKRAVGIGREIEDVTRADNVVIGSRSSENSATISASSYDSNGLIKDQINSATVGSMSYGGFAGSRSAAVFSIGRDKADHENGDYGDAERRLINVAAGEISARSTDAINGSQLYAVANAIPATYTDNNGNPLTKIGNKFYAPGNYVVAPDGKVYPEGSVVGSNGKVYVAGTKLNKDGEPVDAAGLVITAAEATEAPTANGDVVVSLISPNENKTKTADNAPTTLANVQGTLDGAVKQPDGTFNTAPTTNSTGTLPTGAALNNAATVGDVLNAGWNLKHSDGKTDPVAKDFVRHADNVIFANGNATTASVVTSTDGTTSTIKYDVNVDNDTITIKDGKLVAKQTVDTNTVTTVTGSGAVSVTGGTGTGDKAYVVSVNTDNTLKLTGNQLGVNVDNSTIKVNGQGQLYAVVTDNNTVTSVIDSDTTTVTADTTTNPAAPTYKVDVKKATVSATPTDVASGTDITVNNAGKVVAPTTAANKDNHFVTADVLTTVVNAAGFTLKTSAVTGGTKVSGTDEVINPGETVDMVAGKNLTVKQEASGKVTYATADDVTFNKVTSNTVVVPAANGDVVINNAGINAGNNKVTGVADGDISPTSKEAVNGSQLYNLQQVVGGNTLNSMTTTPVQLNDGTTVNVVESNGYTLKTYNVKDQTNYITNNMVEAIGRMNEEGIKFFHVNDENVNKSTVQSGNTVDSSASGAYSAAIGYQAEAKGDNSVALGKKAIADKDNAIAIGINAQANAKNTISIGNGNIVNGENSGAIGDPSKIDAANSYSVGNNNEIAAGQTDVFALGNEVKKTQSNSVFLGSKSGSFEQANAGTGRNGVHTKTATSNYTYKGENDANVAGVSDAVGVVSVGNATETRQIQGVAAGVVSATSTDAINGSQLYYTNKAIQNNLDNKINKLGDVVNKNNRQLRAGIAGTNAAASLPQVYLPGKSMVAASAGTFKGEGALAVGYSRASDNGKVILKLQGNANTRGDFGAGVGVGYQW